MTTHRKLISLALLLGTVFAFSCAGKSEGIYPPGLPVLTKTDLLCLPDSYIAIGKGDYDSHENEVQDCVDALEYCKSKK
jgi:hypothetical protein